MNYRTSRSWYSQTLTLSLLAAALTASADAGVMTRTLRQIPSPQHFDFCWGGTCAAVETVELSQAEWAQVRALFDPLPADAAAERAAIAQAIGLLETIVGRKTGTAGDRAGTFGNSAWPGQLDCNDEATNSTTYMRMMQTDGLIRLHTILDTKTRGGILIFGRHSTAVIGETATNQRFAVDSWFYDNGHPAVILPLETWQTGWKPGNTIAH